ncbi:Glycoside hydrolase, family 31 [Carpediemonas membranifera]|uniref:Glycoside hydrolase, family 31 n=1 Tax=Carpediemonas membranifera TaxID=201153 RepID=A0A8J6E2B8_9EUKA|nr:Glycoside hydrolase, family 31 [Carpediemonas membranifera]|eukprot:KAG9391717.1 Glycoside hydrolase, family 31 [Carpediemonas membranifera]
MHLILLVLYLAILGLTASTELPTQRSTLVVCSNVVVSSHYVEITLCDVNLPEEPHSKLYVEVIDESIVRINASNIHDTADVQSMAPSDPTTSTIASRPRTMMDVLYRDDDLIIVKAGTVTVRLSLDPLSIHVLSQKVTIASINRNELFWFAEGGQHVVGDVTVPDNFTLLAPPGSADFIVKEGTVYRIPAATTQSASFPVLTAISPTGMAASVWWRSPHGARMSGKRAKYGTTLTCVSSNGPMQLFIAVAPTPSDLSERWNRLLSFPIKPPLWSLGLHARGGHTGHEQNNIPIDVIWTDRPENDPGLQTMLSDWTGKYHKRCLQPTSETPLDVPDVWPRLTTAASTALVYEASVWATLRETRPDERPLVVTKTGSVGMHRYAALWGAEITRWSDLQEAPALMASLAMTGTPWAGVSGGPTRTTEELSIRMYQLGAFLPLFRGPAGPDISRSGMWGFDPAVTDTIRRAVGLKYSLIQYIYTSYILTGRAVAPMLAHFPDDARTHAVSNQLMIGDNLLVAPVLERGAVSRHVYLPGNSTRWYPWPTTGLPPKELSGGQDITVPVTIDTIPVFQRGGTVIWRRDRLRRDTRIMQSDGVTIVVALAPDEHGSLKAEGNVLFDDGVTIKGPRLVATSVFERSSSPSAHFVLHNSPTVDAGYLTAPRVEKIIIRGMNRACRRMWVAGSGDLTFYQDEEEGIIEIRRPGVFLDQQWSLLIK